MGAMNAYFTYEFAYIWVLIPGIIIALWAQFRVNTTFKKYSAVNSERGLTGSQTARHILDAYGLEHVPVEKVSGTLTDHFDPTANVVRLSDSTYASQSVAAIGVAAHEVGHAIQYAKKYTPIKIRNAIYPVSAIGSNLAPLFVVGGLIFSASNIFIWIGVGMFAFAVFFSLITLPVEFDASKRAIAILGNGNMLSKEEIKGSKKVLSAAAMTYVAAALTALLSLIRLIFLARSRDR